MPEDDGVIDEENEKEIELAMDEVDREKVENPH